jgi:pimeloyl-ACP methyl ester carboxylesterase
VLSYPVAFIAVKYTMKSAFFAALAALIATSAASPTPDVAASSSSSTICQILMLPISVNATNTNIVGVDQTFSNQTYATGTILQLTGTPKEWGTAHISGEYINRKTYNIHARYCTPRKGTNPKLPLIVAVHGPGYNSKYWDFNFKPEYSLVNQATSRGYSILIYDRLGTGLSDTTSDGFNEPQISTEVEILANILAQLKVGSIIRGTKFDKIVGVGHSYGSFQVQAITKGYPALLDAAILTAYSADSSNAAEFLVASNYEIAKDVFPQKFGHRPSYWLVTPSDSAIISTFFWPPNYDSEAFTFSRNNVDVISLGSYTTVAGVVGTAPDFTGKVHVITGDKDLSSCHYNCSTGGPVAAVKQYYPNPLCNFTYQIVPNTGHSIVPHYTGPQVLEDMLDFIKDI